MSKAKAISKTASEKKTKPVPSRGVAKEKAKAPSKVTASKASASKASASKTVANKTAASKASASKVSVSKASAPKVSAPKVNTSKVSEEKSAKSKTKTMLEEKPKSKAKTTAEKKVVAEKKVEKKSKPKSTSVSKAKTRTPSKSASEEKVKAKTKVTAPKSKAKSAKAKTTKEAPKPKAKSPAKKKSKAVAPKATPAKTVATDKKATKTTSKKSSTGTKKKTKKATKVEGGKGGSVASEPEASSSSSTKGKTPKKSATPSKATKKKAEPKAQKTTVKKSSAKTKGVKKKARAKKVALASVELEETAPEVVADEPLPKEQTEEFRTSLKGSYKFSVPAMLALLDLFVKRAKLTDEEGMKIVGVETAKRYNEYRNFLFTGDFIDRGGKSFIKTEKLDKLWEAFKSLDYRTIADYLNQVPSFFSFLGNLKVGNPSLLKDIPSISKSAYPTYCTLAEIAGVALNIADEGIYLTNHYPSIDDFTKMALESYHIAQAKAEKTVLTGLWLEILAKKYGVHPMMARHLLQQAQQDDLLKVSLEGTTPPTQFRKHIMYYLNLEKGVPTLQQLNLYNGDFITSDRTSVSIRVEESQ